MTPRPASTAKLARVSAAARRGAFATSAALTALTTPHAASAHAAPTAYCSARTTAGGLEMEFEVPKVSLQERSELLEEVAAHVRASTTHGKCELRASGPHPGTASARFELQFLCPAGPITLSTDFGQNLNRDAEVVCAIDGAPHVFRTGALDLLVGTPPTWLEQSAQFVRLGALHVARGLDHVLFVVSLLLGAVTTSVAHAGRRLREIVAVVSGFTLGHSLTLILSASGLVRLPSAFTESLIALSIVFVAVDNLFQARPRGRGWVSLLFGLVHGFGFASALAQVHLPRRGALAALLAFNVGIELAQIAFVLVCFPALVWASQRVWFRARLLFPACAAIAVLGSIWFCQRAFGP